MEEREDSGQDKTEEASEERRRQYREQGNIANPKEIVASFALFACTISFLFYGKSLYDDLQLVFMRSFSMITRHSFTYGDLLPKITEIFSPIVPFLAGMSIFAMTFPITVGLILTKFNFTTKKLEFDLTKLNPISGMSRIISFQGLQELLKSVVKMIIYTYVCYYSIKDTIFDSELTHFQESSVFFGVLSSSTFKLFMSISLASFVFGILDFGINWFQIEKKMMMSKQEIKEENKSQEGDPLVKSQRRRMARDIVMRKTIAKVPEATFVVTNPTHYSVAIKYTKGMPSPVVIAKGQDFMALKIREIAKAHDIVMVENRALARTLYKTVKIGQEVPPSLYSAVIEVMKYIYQVKGREYFQRFQIQN